MVTHAGSVMLARGDLDAATQLLVRAFDRDPLFRCLFPAAAGRARVCRALFRRALTDALELGVVEGALLGGTLVGVIASLPPGTFPPSRARNARMLPALLTAAIHFPRSTRRILRVVAADARAHVGGRHWYLTWLGVAPDAQERGVGSRLLEGALERADRDQAEAFLVTSNPRNIAWYERYGFRTVATMVSFPAAPPCWAMVRPRSAPAP